MNKTLIAMTVAFATLMMGSLASAQEGSSTEGLVALKAPSMGADVMPKKHHRHHHVVVHHVVIHREPTPMPMKPASDACPEEITKTPMVETSMPHMAKHYAAKHHAAKHHAAKHHAAKHHVAKHTAKKKSK